MQSKIGSPRFLFGFNGNETMSDADVRPNYTSGSQHSHDVHDDVRLNGRTINLLFAAVGHHHHHVPLTHSSFPNNTIYHRDSYVSVGIAAPTHRTPLCTVTSHPVTKRHKPSRSVTKRRAICAEVTQRAARVSFPDQQIMATRQCSPRSVCP